MCLSLRLPPHQRLCTDLVERSKNICNDILHKQQSQKHIRWQVAAFYGALRRPAGSNTASAENSRWQRDQKCQKKLCTKLSRTGSGDRRLRFERCLNSSHVKPMLSAVAMTMAIADSINMYCRISLVDAVKRYIHRVKRPLPGSVVIPGLKRKTGEKQIDVVAGDHQHHAAEEFSNDLGVRCSAGRGGRRVTN